MAIHADKGAPVSPGRRPPTGPAGGRWKATGHRATPRLGSSCAATERRSRDRRSDHHHHRRRAGREGPPARHAPGHDVHAREDAPVRGPRSSRRAARDGRPTADRTPCRAEITIDLPVPQSWPQKRWDAALRGDTRPTTRPDADNYIKSALDSINEIAVTDDSLVVELVAVKRYAVPQLTITIAPLPAF